MPHIRQVLQTSLVVVCLSIALPHRVLSGSLATLRLERAPTPAGPWSSIDLGSASLDADGNPRLPVNSTNEYYRTRIVLGAAVGPGDKIAMAEVPAIIRSNALQVISKRIRLNADSDGWPEGVELSPLVLPVHDVDASGPRAAYFEFKVIRPPQPKPPVGPLGTHPDDYVNLDAGYLLMSATSDDFPVMEFATEGPTLSETLARTARTSRFRLVRYGPGLAVAEDERGGILASLGSMPFKLDTNIFALDGLEWTGNDTNGTDVSPRIIPTLRAVGYPSYAAFKKDFMENDVYERLRQIKRSRAKLEWDILNGNPPDGVSIPARQTARVLTSVPLVPLPEVLLTGENDAFARVTVSSTGGILVTGVAPGQGLLRVRAGRQEYNLIIKVTPAVAKLNGPELIASATFYAGDWSMQPKYHQFENSDWCPVVGCGPVAWAMLFAWFDRNWGVEYAFNGEPSGQMPPSNTSSSANRAKVLPAYRELHEQCDVICLAGSGATYPTDMTEGFKGYTWISAVANLIGRSWRINAVTGTWPEAGALRCRDAIKDGYPAVVGLGYMWHYALAYGYAYETYDLGTGYNATIRYLKCNMGWGPNVSPRWYNLGDTFYAADVKIWRGPNG